MTWLYIQDGPFKHSSYLATSSIFISFQIGLIMIARVRSASAIAQLMPTDFFCGVIKFEDEISTNYMPISTTIQIEKLGTAMENERYHISQKVLNEK